MIQLGEPKPDHYETLVLQVFSPVHRAWCDYRDLGSGALAAPDWTRSHLANVRTIHAGYEFRLVRREVRDTVVS